MKTSDLKMRTTFTILLLYYGAICIVNAQNPTQLELLQEIKIQNAALIDRVGKIETRLTILEKGVSFTKIPIDAGPAEKGALVDFYRVEKVDSENFTIPAVEKPFQTTSASDTFCANTIRNSLGYDSKTRGIVVWKGDVEFRSGTYEFRLFWSGTTASYSTGTENCKGLFQLLSTTNEKVFSLSVESESKSHKIQYAKKDLPTGIYTVQISNCTPRTRNIHVKPQFRRFGQTEWNDINPVRLVSPRR